jgi:ribosomal protein L34E
VPSELLGLPDTTVRAARTLRRRLLQVPGGLTRHARRWTLHLPARCAWHGDYLNALNRIRALPAGA